jgi:hypothetical protein
MFPKKKKPEKKKRPPVSGYCHRNSAVQLVFNSDETNPSWQWFISTMPDVIDGFIESRETQAERDRCNDLLQAAIEHWHCDVCSGFELSNIQSGWIPCNECHLFYHRRCVNMEVFRNQ